MNELLRNDNPKVSNVIMDDITKKLILPFDYQSDGSEKFYPFEIPVDLPTDWGIGIIVGASGTGKTTLLKEFGNPEVPKWEDNRSIASHFNSAEEANELLAAAGLMSIPEWVKPFNVLSNGQQFRANLARSIKDDAVIDEFTSVVDRNVARAASTAMARYVRKNNIKRIVLSTVHRDILDFIQPDWVIDTDKGTWTTGRWLQQPQLDLTIYPANYAIWDYFSPYHYLSEKINKSAHCYVGVWDEQVVAFNSCLAQPSGTLKNAFRGHRLVIHPDYQGFGFGPKMSEAVAQHYLDNGKRYFAKTAHPRLGGYRDNSPLWRPTSKNHMKRKDMEHNQHERWIINTERWTFSHEYIGLEN